MRQHETDILIIGAGPAGLTAAIYAARSGKKTLVLESERAASRLALGYELENYPGFAAINSRELLDKFRSQAAGFGAEFATGDVIALSLESSPKFVSTSDAFIEARAVILATGKPFAKERQIPGEERLLGYGVSYCAVCDAFFYRGKDVAVLGGGDYAVHEAMELLPTSRSVTLLTNGGEPQTEIPEPLKICRNEIASLEGDRSLQRVVFRDGTELQAAGLFVALGVAGSTALARKVGAATENSRIVVDENMATTVPGLFAAGDCTGGMLQIAKADERRSLLSDSGEARRNLPGL